MCMSVCVQGSSLGRIFFEFKNFTKELTISPSTSENINVLCVKMRENLQLY